MLPSAAAALPRPDTHGNFEGIPIVVQIANAMNKTKLVRSVMESQPGVDRNTCIYPVGGTDTTAGVRRSARHDSMSASANTAAPHNGNQR